ncbi:response regulator transcription factor [Alkalicoccus daliensis]|uniref:Two component transcriptional regulator, AraC family n=1 Tax=Alkalicoccus daliensis TaxID=745820 RepID=A0A1H0HXH2_9BACI|nr:response regulator [Alkalicoccus daliensis]SDO23521.1 two component transcriptional regulator, AraC family [Alkalicoccus daliensis]
MRNPLILIVDDEPKSRQGLKRRLDAWNEQLADIHTAGTAFEALEFMQEHEVDLLITDIRMPEMTGLELIEKTKKLNQEPVFIVISAYSEFEYAQRALKMGVVNYLLKPVKKEAFIEAVSSALAAREKKDRYAMVEKAMEDPALEQIESLPEPLQEAAQFIEEHLGEKFSLKDVAAHVHLNPSYFSVLFKEQMGITFSEFLTRKRLQQAKRILLTSDLPVGEIAERTGYQTAKYFIQIFKEYEGKTPSKYRKEARED